MASDEIGYYKHNKSHESPLCSPSDRPRPGQIVVVSPATYILTSAGRNHSSNPASPLHRWSEPLVEKLASFSSSDHALASANHEKTKCIRLGSETDHNIYGRRESKRSWSNGQDCGN
jgi:hypothetical protein